VWIGFCDKVLPKDEVEFNGFGEHGVSRYSSVISNIVVWSIEQRVTLALDTFAVSFYLVLMKCLYHI
jgi:hypothetical protein